MKRLWGHTAGGGKRIGGELNEVKQQRRQGAGVTVVSPTSHGVTSLARGSEKGTRSSFGPWRERGTGNAGDPLEVSSLIHG